MRPAVLQQSQKCYHNAGREVNIGISKLQMSPATWSSPITIIDYQLARSLTAFTWPAAQKRAAFATSADAAGKALACFVALSEARDCVMQFLE